MRLFPDAETDKIIKNNLIGTLLIIHSTGTCLVKIFLI